MTLEVRQLVLKSSVGGEAGEAAPGASEGVAADGEEREQLKAEILAECRLWLLDQLQQQRER